MEIMPHYCVSMLSNERMDIWLPRNTEIMTKKKPNIWKFPKNRTSFYFFSKTFELSFLNSYDLNQFDFDFFRKPRILKLLSHGRA